jgi:hypothetical protein
VTEDDGLEIRGEKYGLPLQVIVEMSDPQIPLNFGKTLIHWLFGNGGGFADSYLMQENLLYAISRQCGESNLTMSHFRTDLLYVTAFCINLILNYTV